MEQIQSGQNFTSIFATSLLRLQLSLQTFQINIIAITVTDGEFYLCKFMKVSVIDVDLK